MCYGHFDNCDTIFIEIQEMPDNLMERKEWFQFAFQGVVGAREEHKFGRPGKLRYFFVGNKQQGFYGIERDISNDLTFLADDENLFAVYTELNDMEGRKILREIVRVSMKCVYDGSKLNSKFSGTCEILYNLQVKGNKNFHHEHRHLICSGFVQEIGMDSILYQLEILCWSHTRLNRSR
jgi:hypothetical protein